jgi:hypothetical protein
LNELTQAKNEGAKEGGAHRSSFFLHSPFCTPRRWDMQSILLYTNFILEWMEMRMQRPMGCFALLL